MAGEQYPFPRNYRLTKTDEYSSVFGFRKAVKGSMFMLHFGSPTETGKCARIGLVVGKKLIKQAVRRNTIKRIARDVFRLNHRILPFRDIVIRLSSKFSGMPRKEIAAELTLLLMKLCRQDQKIQLPKRKEIS